MERAELVRLTEGLLRSAGLESFVVSAAGRAPEPDPGGHQFWIRTPGGSRVGVYVPADDDESAQLVRLADLVQDVIVEELPARGRPAVWPECPDHPDSHPLQPAETDGPAMWSCPRTGRRVRAIAPP